jgi:hypothetical protein
MGLGIDNLKSDQNITIRSVYGKIGESAKGINRRIINRKPMRRRP